MEEFKRTRIIPHIISTNKRERVYQTWVSIFDEYPVNYDDWAENDVLVPPMESHFPRSFYEDEKTGNQNDGD